MKKYKIGFTAGMFDILHIGHLDVLRTAKMQCEHLIVAVGTDDFLRIRKQREPVLSYNDRVEIIRAIRYVDTVVPEHDLDKIAAFHEYHFNAMFAGEDHMDEPVYIRAQSILKEFGVDTVYIPHLHKISSTQIRNKLTHDTNK